MSIMCNLSLGIREDVTEAATKATTLKFVISMYNYDENTARI